MQGFNRYYPPDYNGKDTLNKLAGKHALGDRARKLDQGILITRFELPFNIWCGHCDAHVGMGVRYNAEKKKIGNYYSTPIYSFRCKCHLCSGWFEVQTDPKNTRYVVTEGARQQVQDWDPEENGGHPVSYTNADEGENKSDAFEKFEKASSSKKRALTASERLAELEEHSEERWSDPYVLNRSLRKALRADKGKMREKRDKDTELADRYGLGDSIRLDIVRGAEDKVEGDTTATWLSTGQKKETKQMLEDREQWEITQTKRRKLGFDSQDRGNLLVAETGWSEGKTPIRELKSSTLTAVKTTPSATPSAALSRLKNQLKLNSAKKVDPFLGGFSPSLAWSPGVLSSAGLLVKASKR